MTVGIRCTNVYGNRPSVRGGEWAGLSATAQQRVVLNILSILGAINDHEV